MQVRRQTYGGGRIEGAASSVAIADPAGAFIRAVACKCPLSNSRRAVAAPILNPLVVTDAALPSMDSIKAGGSSSRPAAAILMETSSTLVPTPSSRGADSAASPAMVPSGPVDRALLPAKVDVP